MQEYACSSPVQIPLWAAIIAFVCHCILFYHLYADNEDIICAMVHHLKPSPKYID